MLGKFYPSKIENEIYNIMENHMIGIDTYNEDTSESIINFFSKHPNIEFQLVCSEWPNCEGGVCAISFQEEGHPHLIMFDYRK